MEWVAAILVHCLPQHVSAVAMQRFEVHEKASRQEAHLSFRQPDAILRLELVADLLALAMTQEALQSDVDSRS